MYVTTPNNDDVLTAVTGGDEFLALHTTTSFYQNVWRCLGSNISPAMMVVAPDAAYDSWVTIGATSSDDLGDGEAQLILELGLTLLRRATASQSMTTSVADGTSFRLVASTGSLATTTASWWRS